MKYCHKRLSDGRWGLYIDSDPVDSESGAPDLLATIGSEEVCLEMLKRLNQVQQPLQEPEQISNRHSRPSSHAWFDQFSYLAG